MRDIEVFLEQQLNVPVRRAHTLTGQLPRGAEAFSADILNEIPRYSISLGLARREILLEYTR